MSTTARHTIYVVDDDQACRDALRWILRSAGLRVEAYATAEHFLGAHKPGTASCLILDMRMPGMSGLDLQEELIRRREYLPIIFVTAHSDIPMAVRAVKRGALDVIEKPFNGRALLAAVHDALRQTSTDLATAASRAAVNERVAALSGREYEVMRCVVDGMTNKAIASELGISVKTVECHRSRMMDKLNAGSVAELVRLVASSSAAAMETSA
jgi:FixJ family two-component response regulator